MAVAETYQVPRSILLGRPWPAPGQPLFLPEDLEWALEYRQHCQSVCSGCHTRREEWEGLGPEDDPPYVPRVIRCPGCHELAVADEDIPEKERARGARSVLIPVGEYDLRQDIRDAAERLGLRRRAGG